MVTDNKLYKVAITVDGNYVHGKYYDTLTQVYYAEEDGGDGCSYVSVKPNQNVIPGTDDTVWKRSSRSGKGEKGDKGDTGERGPQGEPGEIDEQQLQEIESQIAAKQDALVSGTNIKTIGDQSILGSGNIQVGDENAVKFVSQSLTDLQKTQARTNIGAASSASVPAISTSISTDASSDVKTASPKAVKIYVDGVASAINGDIEDLGISIETIGNGTFVVAWDGDSTPVAANIPSGVSVTYDSDSYTGILAASAATLGKIYLVATGTSGNYDRYVTVGDSTYSWVHIGTTSVALEEYATNSKVGQLEAKVDDMEVETSEDSDLDFIDENAYSIVRFEGGHIKTKNFDSSDMSKDASDSSDFDIIDPEGHSIVRFEGGHIKVKNFDSGRIEEDFVQKDLDIFFNAVSEKQHYDTVSSTTKNVSFPYDLKKNICFALKADFTTFATITIGKGYNAYSGYWFVIDSANISLYYNQGSTTLSESVAHGLTFSDFVKIVISNIGDDYCRFFIQTRSGQFAYNFVWTYAANGQAFFTTAGTLTNVDFIASCSDLKNDVWLFGDSYVGMANPARWPKQLRTMGYSNFLCDGLAGQNSSGAYSDLQRCLELGVKPKILVWTLGMNDTDSSWNTTYQQVQTLCESNDITLILATIPTVPIRNNENKNTTIRNSGYDYIDFAKAVGANSSGVWYSGYLSSDEVHPTELGAKALATQFIFDFILKH